MYAHLPLEANEMIYTTRHPICGEVKMLGLPVKLKEPQGNPRVNHPYWASIPRRFWPDWVIHLKISLFSKPRE